jgi:hypothetical protein
MQYGRMKRPRWWCGAFSEKISLWSRRAISKTFWMRHAGGGIG